CLLVLLLCCVYYRSLLSSPPRRSSDLTPLGVVPSACRSLYVSAIASASSENRARVSCRSSSRKRIQPPIDPPPKELACIGIVVVPFFRKTCSFDGGSVSETSSVATDEPTSSAWPRAANRLIVPSSCSCASTVR